MTLALTSAMDWLRFRISLAAPPPPPGTTPPPVYGGGGMNEQAPNAVTMLILAILGYVVCAPCAWVAFFMARGAKMQYPNCGMTKAAY